MIVLSLLKVIVLVLGSDPSLPSCLEGAMNESSSSNGETKVALLEAVRVPSALDVVSGQEQEAMPLRLRLLPPKPELTSNQPFVNYRAGET